jgi:hypothetical protein
MPLRKLLTLRCGIAKLPLCHSQPKREIVIYRFKSFSPENNVCWSEVGLPSGEATEQAFDAQVPMVKTGLIEWDQCYTGLLTRTVELVRKPSTLRSGSTRGLVTMQRVVSNTPFS